MLVDNSDTAILKTTTTITNSDFLLYKNNLASYTLKEIIATMNVYHINMVVIR